MKNFKLATVTLLVAAAAMSTSAFAKDGTYTAQEVGRNGAVKVQVVVKGNKIESVKVLDWSETHPVADLTQTQQFPKSSSTRQQTSTTSPEQHSPVLLLKQPSTNA